MIELYIDPGTGSMLFTILLGILGAGFYAARGLAVKLRFLLSGGKVDKKDEKKLPYVIFSDSKRYWNLFQPICREFEKRGESLTYMTASPDDPALQEEFEHVKCEFIGEGNRAFARLNMLRADVVLSTTPGLDVYQWKRSKDVKWYVHVPHMVTDITTYRMFGIDYYDAILMSGEYSEHQVRELERIRNLPQKELRLAGMPYMDELLRKKEEAGPAEDHPMTVLLAPSWGPSSILNRYGEKIFDALLSTGYQIVVRPHPQSYTSEKELLERLQKAYPDSDQLQWNRDNDNFEILRRADILISDFSGVAFDYSLVFDKPIIYADTSFDNAVYDACWLDEELWMFRILPELGMQLTMENLPDIKALIDACRDDPKYAAGREKARRESWANIGHSAEVVTDYMIEKRSQLLAQTEETK